MIALDDDARTTPTAIGVAALTPSEERYRFLVETSPVQLWTSLPDGNLDYVTDQTASRLGLTPDRLLADGWQNVVHAEDLPRAVERWTHALGTGETYEVEFRLKLASGEYAWHLARAVPQRDAAGAIVRWFGTNTNIEDERAHQRRTQALLDEVEQQAATLREQNHLLELEAEIGSALNRTETLAETLAACAASVVRHIDAAFARIWTVDEAGTMLELQASAGMYTHLDGPHSRVPVGKFKIGLIAAERRPHLTNRVVGDSGVGDQAWAVREGMVAFAGFPLLVGEKVVGVIAAFARHSLSEASVSALGSTANGLAQAIERRRAEERLREVAAERSVLLAQEQRARRDAEQARAELRSLFMQAPAPICVLRGPEHVYELVNPAYQELVGRDRKLIGRTTREARPDLAGLGFYELLDRVYATGERFVGQRRIKVDRRKDGTLDDAVLDFVFDAYRDLEGNVAGVLVIGFDVTAVVVARESAQATLEDRERLLGIAEDARRRAETASRAKDEFLATASHELRTPLNAILGWARILRSGTVDPSGFMRGLETIERNAKAQVQLIEDILDGSRIITGKLYLEIRPLDLTAVVRAALDAVSPAAAARNIALEVTLDPAAAHVSGDPDRLQQVVWNLVNNAIKFTPKGGKVEVRASRVGTHVEVSVKDNGEGISAAFLPHVFERFRQADGGTTRRHGGLGLGLALVRHLVEAHGGDVRAASEGEGKGSEFTLTLPVLAIRPQPSAPDTSAPRIGGVGRATLPQNALQGVRALVVDDEPDARELVATVLRTHGAEVWIATSVDQAIALLEEHAPAVLVSDIGMPVTDGYAFLRRVRALGGAVARTPAIALTAYARAQDRNLALDAGFQDYLAKPVDPDALVKLVRKVSRLDVVEGGA